MNALRDKEVALERSASPARTVRRGKHIRWMRISRPIGFGLLSIMVGLIIWEVIAKAFYKPFILPAVSDIVAEASKLVVAGQLLLHIKASYLRILIGFVAGSFAGAVMGMAMGTVIHVRRVFEPLVNFFRFVPPIAWLAPALIWFGIGETSKILLIVYTTCFTVLLNAIAGVSAVPRNRARAARCLGATSFQLFKLVLLPSTVPYILTGMSIGLTNSFATIVTAEMLAAQSGLGYLILVSRNYMATDTIFVGIVTLGALGLVTSQLFGMTLHRVAWRYFLQR